MICVTWELAMKGKGGQSAEAEKKDSFFVQIVQILLTLSRLKISQTIQHLRSAM